MPLPEGPVCPGLEVSQGTEDLVHPEGRPRVADKVISKDNKLRLGILGASSWYSGIRAGSGRQSSCHDLETRAVPYL